MSEEKLQAEIQRLNVYVNQLEREVLNLKKEKTEMDIKLNAHISLWSRQTGYTFTGFADCGTLYEKRWKESDKVVMLRK